MTTPLLTLNTKHDRPPIVIDGEQYELKSPDELTIVQHQMLAACGRRMERLLMKDDLTQDEQSELLGAVRNSTNMILDLVPKEVQEKLTDMNRVTILQAYADIPLKLAAQARKGKKD